MMTPSSYSIASMGKDQINKEHANLHNIFFRSQENYLPL